MWMKLKRMWINNPKGTIIPLAEVIGIRLQRTGVGESCNPPEKVSTKSIYFPGKKVDAGETEMVNGINNMTRVELINFIEENELGIDFKNLILADLRAAVTQAAINFRLRFEDEEEIKIPVIKKRGQDKMMKISPVIK